MYADMALERLDDLKREGSYRTFVTLNRHAGRYPMATVKRDGGMYEDVQVWCSNDYLAMSQHPTVIAAMQDIAADAKTNPERVTNTPQNTIVSRPDETLAARQIILLIGWTEGLA